MVKLCVAGLFLILFVSGSGRLTQAAIVDEVILKDQISVGGRTLVLNGAGTRKATFLRVKVYVAGLYLESPNHNAAEILSSKQLKRIELHFVHDVSADKLNQAWEESFEKTCKPNCSKFRGSLKELKSFMLDVKKGDSLSFTFFPDHIDVIVKDQPVQKIMSNEYPRVLLETWLGAEPPNQELKDGLLGEQKK